MFHFIRESKLRKEFAVLKDVLKGVHETGWGNGYVLIPPGHSQYNKDYNDIPVSVHGGLTFGDIVDGDMIKDLIVDVPEIIKYEGYHMVGFYTAHYGDNIHIWSKDSVEEETIRLLKQLENM